MAKPNVELALQNEFLRAARECIGLGYNPTGFLQLLGERGPVATAIHLVMGNYEGFDRLWQLRRLDLSVEAIILQEPYRSLFPFEVMERAHRKLKEVGFLA